MGQHGLQGSQPVKPCRAVKQGRRPSVPLLPPLPVEPEVSGEKDCGGALRVSLAAPLKTGGRVGGAVIFIQFNQLRWFLQKDSTLTP